MKLEEKRISTKNIFAGKVVTLNHDQVELPSGEHSFREWIDHAGGACVLAQVDDKIYFVKQYRYPYQEVLLELPAGKLNKGEDPLLCAKRELEEETGLIADNLQLLHCIYPTPGYSNEKIYVYIANQITQGNAHLDSDEFLNVEAIDVQKVKQMVQNGEIRDAKTLIALYCYFSK